MQIAAPITQDQSVDRDSDCSNPEGWRRVAEASASSAGTEECSHAAGQVESVWQYPVSSRRTMQNACLLYRVDDETGCLQSRPKRKWMMEESDMDPSSLYA